MPTTSRRNSAPHPSGGVVSEDALFAHFASSPSRVSVSCFEVLPAPVPAPIADAAPLTAADDPAESSNAPAAIAVTTCVARSHSPFSSSCRMVGRSDSQRPTIVIAIAISPALSSFASSFAAASGTFAHSSSLSRTCTLSCLRVIDVYLYAPLTVHAASTSISQPW